jgi:glycosyltransferase involved in cell wall biosynthesis
MMSGDKYPSLSAFFPAYNDAPSLPSLISSTFAVLEEHVEDYEVIVVNDGSRDDTGRVLEQLRALHGPRLRVITHPQNRGYGAALRSGFAAARKHLIFYTDGDGQYDVSELPALLARLGPYTGFVNGYKLERHDPIHRVWIGKAYNRFARFLFGIRLRDIDCDYRLVRRELIEQISLESTSGTVCIELVRQLEMSGWDFEEVGVRHYPRLHGRSQFFRVRSLLATFCQLARLYRDLVVTPLLVRKAHRTA